MSIRALLRVLAASAFLLLPAAPSVAEKVPPPSPATAGKSVKTEIAKARALMKLRRYDLALVVLRPLVQDPGHRDSVLFLTGIAALEHSQKEGREAKSRDTLLSEAIAYFRTMLIRNPGLVRVRLELAHAFFLKGEDDLARRHFEQVLAGKPSAQVVVNVNRFLGQIRARKRGGLRVGMALTPDRIPAAPSVAETVPPPSPATAGGTQEAKALARAGRFEEALAILRPLAAANPGDLNVRFHIGLSAMGALQRPGLSDDARDALLDEAVAALRTMLIDRPDLVRVRLELARAFFFQRKDSLAREHFERVLAGDLPPPVIANVQRFLGAIRARRRWSFYFGAALAPDSNIGSGSDERFINIHVFGSPLPFRRDEEELTTSGVGLSLWTGGEYQHPLGDRVRIRAGGNASRREYAGAEFDSTSLALHAGPRWLVGARTDMSLLGSARRNLVAGTGDSDELGVRVEAARRLTPRIRVNARAAWHDRRYPTRLGLDGPILDLSLGANWVATPTLRIDGSLGYGSERPESESHRNTSRWLRVGLQKALPRGFAVGASARLRWADYEGEWPPHTPPGEFREDRTRTLSASFHHRRFTLYGFSPQIALTNETRTTNAQLYDYKKNLAEIRFVRQF